MSTIRGRTRQEDRRLPWTLAIALLFHLLVLLGINLQSPEPSPRMPVFSLRLAASEQTGGYPGDTASPAPSQVPVPIPETVMPREQPLESIRESLVQGAQPPLALRLKTGPNQPVEPPRPAAVTPPRETPLPTRQTQQPTTSRSTERRDTDRSTLKGQYLERIRQRLEQLGTRHFPPEARRRGLTGRLTLDVTVRADGSLHGLELLQSSGHPVLDQAARRTVLLAAPFAPFPPELRRHYSLLHIVRTWEFDQDNRLRGD
ncbi:MAG: TonB family protein [Candidatus Competibacterales bacterium]|nr:TonB family protein [Candidatus Competibacterales bacterium]